MNEKNKDKLSIINTFLNETDNLSATYLINSVLNKIETMEAYGKTKTLKEESELLESNKGKFLLIKSMMALPTTFYGNKQLIQYVDYSVRITKEAVFKLYIEYLSRNSINGKFTVKNEVCFNLECLLELKMMFEFAFDDEQSAVCFYQLEGGE